MPAAVVAVEPRPREQLRVTEVGLANVRLRQLARGVRLEHAVLAVVVEEGGEIVERRVDEPLAEGVEHDEVVPGALDVDLHGGEVAEAGGDRRGALRADELEARHPARVVRKARARELLTVLDVRHERAAGLGRRVERIEPVLVSDRRGRRERRQDERRGGRQRPRHADAALSHQRLAAALAAAASKRAVRSDGGSASSRKNAGSSSSASENPASRLNRFSISSASRPSVS